METESWENSDPEDQYWYFDFAEFITRNPGEIYLRLLMIKNMAKEMGLTIGQIAAFERFQSEAETLIGSSGLQADLLTRKHLTMIANKMCLMEESTCQNLGARLKSVLSIT